jgi:hypothetical protein
MVLNCTKLEIGARLFPSWGNTRSFHAVDLFKIWSGRYQLILNMGAVKSSICLSLSVPDTHGGGWSRNINARYLHTLMVYL